MTDIRVGLIGAGYIAAWHADALKATDGVAVTAVCDLSESAARELAEACGARLRNRNAMSPVPPATSRSRWPARGASQSIIASIQSLWMPPDITSFITS